MCRAPVLATLVVLANRWDVASTPLHTSPPGPVSQLVTHLSRARLLRTSRVRCSQKLTAPTHPCLVHEHHPPVIERNQPWSAKPTSATRPVRSLRPIFFRLCPRRLIARQIVASLTLTPQIAERNSPLCLWVAHGRTSRSSLSSHIALWFSFGCLPSLRFGAGEPLSSSRLT
jgi:hypothetical protein